MDTMEALLTRRSVRDYTDKAISEEVLQELVKAGMYAPSAGNEQPWHFVVLDDRRILDEIPKFHAYAQMLKQAPAAILVCGDETLEKYKGFWVQDCSAAVQNILLAAHANGLGAVWLGVYPIEERVTAVRKLLGIPGHVIPFAVISLGYPARDAPRVERFDASRLRRNEWQ